MMYINYSTLPSSLLLGDLKPYVVLDLDVMVVAVVILMQSWTSETKLMLLQNKIF